MRDTLFCLSVVAKRHNFSRHSLDFILRLKLGLVTTDSQFPSLLIRVGVCLECARSW